jgi:hypothetical protein
VNYEAFLRKIQLPRGYDAPTRLTYDDIVATAISRTNLSDDVRGINASITLIQKTRGGGWPTEPVTEEFNFVDLVWHECEFREGYSFAYAVYDDRDTYLGCCYLYPMGRRAPLNEGLLDHDVDVSWWEPRTADARRATRRIAYWIHWVTWTETGSGIFRPSA